MSTGADGRAARARRPTGGRPHRTRGGHRPHRHRGGRPARDRGGCRSGRADRRRRTGPGRRRRRGHHVQDREQGGGPGDPGRPRASAIDAETVRRGGPPGRRPASWRPGTAWCSPPPGWTTPTRAPGTVVLLPEDPDASAARLRKGCATGWARASACVITDTMGRPWRAGQTDAAIGAAGMLPVRDYRGQPDTFGTPLEVTLAAVADEIAAAADLVKGKTAGSRWRSCAAWPDLVTAADGPGARALIRPSAEDMFRFGSRRRARRPPDRPGVHRAAGRPRPRCAGRSAPPSPRRRRTTPRRGGSWWSSRQQARTALLDAMLAAWITDLRGDGFTAEQISRRLRRGEPLRRAPLLIVPCLYAEAAHDYPDPRAQRRRAGDVRGRDGRGRAEPAGCPGRRWPRLVLGVQHDVLPGGVPRSARPAARLGPDGRGRRRPPGRAGPGPPAPRPGQLS